MTQEVPSIYYAPSTSGFYVAGINSDVPGDAIEITMQRWTELLGIQAQGGEIRPGPDGAPVATVPVPGPLNITELQAAVQQRLDEFARTRHYDGILSACTYATSKVEQFRTEGQAAVDARDATWSRCYEILAEVQGGARTPPMGVDEVLDELPALEWPAP